MKAHNFRYFSTQRSTRSSYLKLKAIGGNYILNSCKNKFVAKAKSMNLKLLIEKVH